MAEEPDARGGPGTAGPGAAGVVVGRGAAAVTVACGTTRYRDASGWQDSAGYSRAVRRGDTIAVSGTTADGVDGRAVSPGDTAAQVRQALDAVLAAVIALGGGMDDIVRTRLLLTPDADAEAACRVHGEVFAAALPANSTYRVGALLGDGFLVEVEADAVLAAPADRASPEATAGAR